MSVTHSSQHEVEQSTLCATCVTAFDDICIWVSPCLVLNTTVGRFPPFSSPFTINMEREKTACKPIVQPKDGSGTSEHANHRRASAAGQHRVCLSRVRPDARVRRATTCNVRPAQDSGSVGLLRSWTVPQTASSSCH